MPDVKWIIVKPSGRKFEVTYKEGLKYLKAHPEYTYVWVGSACMIVVATRGGK